MIHPSGRSAWGRGHAAGLILACAVPSARAESNQARIVIDAALVEGRQGIAVIQALYESERRNAPVQVAEMFAARL